MKKSAYARVFVLGLTVALPLQGWGQTSAEKVEATRTVIEEWVKTRQLISQEDSEWRTQKELITYKIDLLKTEIEALDTQISESEEMVTTAEVKREELRIDEERLRTAAKVVGDDVRKYEEWILNLSKFFPDPLSHKVSQFLKQIPKDAKRTKVSDGERMAIIIGVLNEVDKFNSSVTVVSELREIGSGETVEVKTMYLGLAQAYYVDGKEKNAAIGRPSSGGWDWQTANESAHNIHQAIAMYENIVKPATFVELPVTISLSE